MEEINEPEKRKAPRMNGKPWVVRALVALPLLLLLGAAGMVLAGKSAEERLLSRAAAALNQGQPETAEAALYQLGRRPLLSREARYRGAALFFRLGEDHAAHALLARISVDQKNPQDRALLEASRNCQRAALLLARADKAQDPPQRLALAREALAVTPEAPRVLQRVVVEELLCLTRKEDPDLTVQFAEDYRKLRLGAPHLADEVKQRARQALGVHTN